MGSEYITSISKTLSSTHPDSKLCTFNESVKLFVLNCPSLEINLQGHEEYKEEFVVLIQTSD
jgi:hypothetical protein